MDEHPPTATDPALTAAEPVAGSHLPTQPDSPLVMSADHPETRTADSGLTTRDVAAEPGRGSVSALATLTQPSGRPTSDEPVFQVGPYLAIKRLGSGGQGAVWLAVQVEGPHRRVALKISQTGWFETGDPDRLLKEFERADKVIHPAILPVYAFGIDEKLDRAYMAMRLVDGFSLSQVISQRRRHLAGQTPEELHRLAILPDGEYLAAVVSLTRIIADALHQAHQVKIIHRDIKPSNILLDQEGHPFLADFGLARDLDMVTTVVDGKWLAGTLPYIPPERFKGEVGDEIHCDIYSLGVTLYEAVTLHRPFDPPGDKSPASWWAYWQKPETHQPRPFGPGVPRDLRAVILKALEASPSRRYGSAWELSEELGRIERGEPVEARPPGLLRKVGRSVARYRFVLAAAGLVLAVAVLGLALAGRTKSDIFRAERMRSEADAAIRDGDLDRARDLLNSAAALRPDDPDNAVLAHELLTATSRELRDAADGENVTRLYSLLDFRRTLGPESLEELKSLGFGPVSLASEPPGAFVTLHAVYRDGRPHLGKPLFTARAGSASAPATLDGVAPGNYWITAFDPDDTAAFVERPFRLQRALNPGGMSPPPVLRLRAGPSDGMVAVPGGRLAMGDDTIIPTGGVAGNGLTGVLYPPEFPSHPVDVARFFLDSTEVTNTEFDRFLTETGRRDWRSKLWPATGTFRPGKGDWPVTNVTFEMAVEYAAWRGCRLPTEAELEWAARGKSSLVYPPLTPPGWRPEGPSWSSLHAVRSEPLDVVDLGGERVFGLFGNAGELTLFRFRPYPNFEDVRVPSSAWAGQAVRCGLIPDPEKVAIVLLGYHLRGSALPDKGSPVVGFRCARSTLPWTLDRSSPLPTSE